MGYARVSTDDQTLALQQDALAAAGCVRVFTDTASGSKRDRVGLEEALAALVAGDVLVVWKLDRLGRSLMHLLETSARVKEKGAAFCSLTEGIDTATACGEMIYNLMGTIAQFERRLISDRTKAGLAAAAARGRLGGRRQQFDPGEIRAKAKELGSRRAVCEAMGICEDTYYRAMRGAA